MFVLTLEGEPIHVYTNLESLKIICRDWFDEHCNDCEINHKYNMWVEDRNWYKDEEQAWDDFVEEQFDDGAWGDYAWYEVRVD